MNALIGYTGLVGQNLDSNLFVEKYNSKNIKDICGKEFDLVVCAGVPGHKTLANQFPDKDWQSITLLMECLGQIRCEKFVLISTIDVYDEGKKADEDSVIQENGHLPYSRHRIKMEKFITSIFTQSSIIRLPGIFGKGLRKNFIFDLIFRIPRMMETMDLESLLKELNQEQKRLVTKSYLAETSNMLYLNPVLSGEELQKLRSILEQKNCTSLRFTDSRSDCAYYDLRHLKKDMDRVIREDIRLINFITEPMSAGELAKNAFDYFLENEISGKPPLRLQVRSKYADLFHGTNGYLYSKTQVIKQLREFDRNSVRI